jgi:hypothetical protein
MQKSCVLLLHEHTEYAEASLVQPHFKHPFTNLYSISLHQIVMIPRKLIIANGCDLLLQAEQKKLLFASEALLGGNA